MSSGITSCWVVVKFAGDRAIQRGVFIVVVVVPHVGRAKRVHESGYTEVREPFHLVLSVDGAVLT